MRWVCWALLFVLCTACGSGGDGADPILVGVGSCKPDTFFIEGDLGGAAVSRRGALTSHAWVQFGSSNTLDVGFEGGGNLQTTWANPVAEGGTTAVTGSIALPSGGPRGGVALNAGSGAMSKLEDEVRFRLEAFTEIVECFAPPCPANPVAGALSGCVRWEHIGP